MSGSVTRKELKEDQFAVEVEHSVDFFAKHRNEVTRYGGAILVVAVLAGGGWWFYKQQVASRQKALGEAIAAMNAPIAQAPPPNGALTFPSDDAKKDAVKKAFSKVASDYKGNEEGYVAEYFLAGQDVEAGKLDDARTKYQDVADHAGAGDSSLAKLALAQVLFAENKGADAENVLKAVIDHPTDVVSKEQATVALARGIAAARPDEAKKLLTSLIANAKLPTEKQLPITGPDLGGIVSQALSELSLQ